MFRLAPRPPAEIVMAPLAASTFVTRPPTPRFCQSSLSRSCYGRDVGLLHDNDGQRGDGMRIGTEPGHGRTRGLQAEGLAAGAGSRSSGLFLREERVEFLSTGASVAVTSPPDSAATVMEPGRTDLIVPTALVMAVSGGLGLACADAERANARVIASSAAITAAKSMDFRLICDGRTVFNLASGRGLEVRLYEVLPALTVHLHRSFTGRLATRGWRARIHCLIQTLTEVISCRWA